MVLMDGQDEAELAKLELEAWDLRAAVELRVDPYRLQVPEVPTNIESPV